MNVTSALSARCASGHHEWQPLGGVRQPGTHVERCRSCGREGVWTPAVDIWEIA